MHIDIGSQYSRLPAGRTPADGKFNGETFRERFLKSNLESGKKIVIVLDNVLSFGSSFLEEAFGGLVRKYGFTAENIKSKIRFVSIDPFLVEEIWHYVDDAK